jgi:hypothetical protein
MLELRSEVREDVEGIFDRAEQLTDWRYYVRRYPWACLAAAAVVGYAIVPKHPAVKLDADALAEALRKSGVAGSANSSHGRTSWLRTGLGIAGSLLLRQAAATAGQELSKILDRHAGASAAGQSNSHPDA